MQLMDRIRGFIDGTDVSVASAGLIEAGLDDAFPDDPRVNDTLLMLASYRPGDAGAQYGEAEVRLNLQNLVPRLR